MEHCRPATSILCGFQATELALNIDISYCQLHWLLNSQYVAILNLKEYTCLAPIYAPFNPFHQISVLLGNKHTPSPGSLKNKTFFFNLSLSLFFFYHRPNANWLTHRFCPPQEWLTSTCIQRLCFSQTSAMRSSGSKAPCTVDPDVQLTRNGTAPWQNREWGEDPISQGHDECIFIGITAGTKHTTPSLRN